ncbi:MAG: disulfide bond formation protein DsbD, partial [Planctomycetes bacterium]|nr:disulfide bond formation protein DsbD [Planctomycetota bacterium]
ACKACDAMKATTLRDPQVAAELEKMEKVEFMADGTDPFTAAVVKRYGVVGLPTYVILEKR